MSDIHDLARQVIAAREKSPPRLTASYINLAVNHAPAIAEALLASEQQVAALAAEVKRLNNGLQEALRFASHYSVLLNSYDGGERRVCVFQSPEIWMVRLDKVKEETIDA